MVEPENKSEAASENEGAASPRPKKPTYRQMVIGVAAVLVVLIIGVSAFAAWASPEEAKPVANTNQGTASDESKKSATGKSSEKKSDASKEAAETPAAQEGDGANKEGEAGDPAPGDQASSDGSEQSADQPIQQAEAPPVSAPAVEAPVEEPVYQEPPAPQAAMITVTVSVTSANVGNPVSCYSTVTLNEGATVYDALLAAGMSPGGSGSYVSSINGLAEKDHGGTSGWMYSVNESYPMMSPSACVLSDGAYVSWEYVV